MTIGAGVAGWEVEPTPEEAALFEEMDRLEESGEPEAVADFDVRTWVDGPGQPGGPCPGRDPRAGARDGASGGQRPADREHHSGRPIRLTPPAAQQLDRLTMPVLAIAGALDVSDVATCARMLEEQVPTARALMMPRRRPHDRPRSARCAGPRHPGPRGAAGTLVSAPRKPRDVGNGLVCASFGRGGEWLSLATVDPEAGYVRAHRSAASSTRSCAATRRPCCATAPGCDARPTPSCVWRPAAPPSRRVRTHPAARGPSCNAWSSGHRDAIDRLASASASAVGWRVPRWPKYARRVGRAMRVSRAARGEVGMPAAAGSKPRAKAREGTLRVSGEGAPVVIQAWLRKPGGTGAASAGHGGADDRSDKRLGWTVLRRRMPTAVAWIEWPAEADEVHVDIACAFDRPPASAPEWQTRPALRPTGGPEAPQHLSEAGQPASRPASPSAQVSTASPSAQLSSGPRPPRAAPESRPLRVPIRLVRSVGQLDQRAATYTRTCTALQVAGAERCILADHRTLPLSWTCDAYWQARLLLATWARGGHDDDAAIVADHLRWLFLRCERPDGRWLRTHHADGRRAGQAFRADQQLYPLLELADFVGATGSLPELPPGPTWAELAGKAWAAAEFGHRWPDRAPGYRHGRGRRAPALPLPRFRPGAALAHRDAAGRRGPAVGLRGHFLDRARGPYPCCLRRRVVTHRPQGRRWAGSVDGRGGVELSIEATDLPLALAPLWSFCKPTDRPWRATMAFALDASNPAFVPGPAGGPGLTSHAGHLDPRRHLRLGRLRGSWASRHPRRLPWRDW